MRPPFFFGTYGLLVSTLLTVLHADDVILMSVVCPDIHSHREVKGLLHLDTISGFDRNCGARSRSPNLMQ